MSYCFNPNCSNPPNPGDGKFCQQCGSKLLLNSVSVQGEPIIYRGIKLIGQGGFGRTFLAVEESQTLTSDCVIKQFFPQSRNIQKSTELFQQEAERLQTLGQHPQIPKGLGYFQQDGYQYLVQEFIEGKNLAQELEEKGAFDQEKIIIILKDLLPVLQFIQEHKVIHRDIKPENIIRRFDDQKTTGNLVLVDFGAAKLVTGGMLPKTGTMIGSAAYTAPEQLMGKAVFASDLYSLGVTCIHLLTNVTPFDLFDSTEGNWVWRDYLKTPVSDSLGQILDKMLRGATRHRYHSASAILQQLNPKPDYVRAMPGLTINPEMGFKPLVENPELITPSPAISTEVIPQILEVPPIPPQNKITQIQEAIEKRLEDYGIVQVQVNQTQRNQLTIVLNRDENRDIQYKQLVPVIGYELTHFQLNTIEKVKLLGRVNNNEVPEWQSSLKVDKKTQLKNKIIRFQNNNVFSLLSQLQSPQFWINQIQRREFWIDGLMVAMIVFIFADKIIILKPIISLLIAGGFWGVKYLVNRTHPLNINQLFITITTLFLVFGWLDLRIWVQGSFGIILAGLFMSMPIFFSRHSS
ncbi:serine/threonine-protein kinase [Planktothrix paucivesiculata]|uniref:non-specific serine/threonine protein kinase n=1 Tax=Planktothrix paucivesiculata PCC 9631 TaxID=671071 RepID=A0A7Z9BW51_9CYAN|nr:serine/threonine-protein kinase [Planktothrix paucivesiculata]VXD20188.1 Serine/threonine kinase [Planktothrix paucivesiculata PCC 9631]